MTEGSRTKLHYLFGTFMALTILASCGSSDDSTITSELTVLTSTDSAVSELPIVAVTYSVLGDIVSQLVGDKAIVNVVIPDGQDPHDFQPSVKDIEMINNAALVISNGLEFEEGLERVLENIADSGGNIFMGGDHITVRKIEERDEHADGDGDHHHGGSDPHLWLSPATILEMLPALTTALNEAIGAEFAISAEILTQQLKDLDQQVAAIIDGLGECKLVTSHDELGYFADRFGCTVVASIIPSFTTTSEATAGDLAKLRQQIKEHNVSAIFAGLDTSTDIANQLANELGVKVVTLQTHYLNGAPNYQQFILRIVDQISKAIG